MPFGKIVSRLISHFASDDITNPKRIYGERVKTEFGRVGTVLDEKPYLTDRLVMYYLVKFDDSHETEEVHCRKLVTLIEEK